MNNNILIKWHYNHFISKSCGSDVNRLSLTLFNSKIKLTPHQIDASLFAFKSPISKGVLLADEVGLGKTIEAGIIIAQLWYERKAKVLIIAPASLIRQWNNELYDKFLLETEIMDRKRFNSYIKKGYENPFKVCKNITICSYQFASINSDFILNSDFDTVIIDEAHKLRNSYREKSITSNNIKYATKNMQKVLLTATPIQNSLLDLFGLSSFIDENLFGDIEVFKKKYIKNLQDYEEELHNRLNIFMHRTLRNQVTQYIKYTNRVAKTFVFTQTPEEKEIYDELQNIISNSSEMPYIIPKSQSHLLLLILCKLMGSSIYALKGTLQVILNRLTNLKNGLSDEEYNNYMKQLIIEKIDEDVIEENNDLIIESKKNIFEEVIDYNELNHEINLIENLITKVDNVKKESKYFTLLESLKYSFSHLKEIGANEKVLIFTESTRTQEFLYKSLKEDGYEDILLYNGSNNTDELNKIYTEWLNRPENVDKKQNDRSMNMRAAIIDKFSKDGKILISTEAGAEGLNLQFCSLIINYDLPWNPQRVEQRIGRCHRFGQKFDVNVINFINNSNRAEQRIYELLSNKFNLFDSVFGASDEILGIMDNDSNMELSIAEIYKNCRTEDEIDNAFNTVQEKFNSEIAENIDKAKAKIIDNFEEDLQQYFSDMMDSTEKNISAIEKNFWLLTKLILNNKAEFNDANMTINIKNFGEYNGTYKISSRNEDDRFIDFNSNTKLGKYILEEASKISNKKAHVLFDISNYPFNLKEVSNLKGSKGIISFNKIKISSYEEEEYLFSCGRSTDGEILDNELINKMFRLELIENPNDLLNEKVLNEVDEDVNIYSNKIFNESTERNNSYLNKEILKINEWAEDKIQGIENSVEMMREQRKELRKQSDLCTNSLDKIDIEEKISKITKKISSSWMELSEAEEIVETKRNKMISDIKKENMKHSELKNIFNISYEVI